jgi:hypothetical protein
MLAALATEPIAGLVDTALIGRLGQCALTVKACTAQFIMPATAVSQSFVATPACIAGAVSLAGLGVGVSIFNTIIKFLTFPLVSASTTLVAEAVGTDEARDAGRLVSTPSVSDSETASLIPAVAVDDTDAWQGLRAPLLQSSNVCEEGDSDEQPVPPALKSESSSGDVVVVVSTLASRKAPDSAVASSASAALLIALMFGLMEVR